jgi:CMP/dCMP kinase
LGQPCVIAIDGEAASGKSTVAARLAEHLGYVYLDTGVMYRAVTWAALDRDVAIADEVHVTEISQSLKVSVTAAHIADGRPYTVWADDRDVTWEIRDATVDAAVSVVAAYVGVREALTAQMRRIAAEQCIIMVGRDIGTVVLPDADLKLYMTASVDERARRRFQELKVRGEATTFTSVIESMRRRDDIDSHREHAPLRAAPDAIICDTGDRTVEEVIKDILALIADRWPTKG